MRLNFSAQTEDEIREGIRRIGAVIGEQVDLYETMTGEHRIVAAGREPDDGGAGRRAPVPPATDPG